jgi:hypothetical protein
MKEEKPSSPFKVTNKRVMKINISTYFCQVTSAEIQTLLGSLDPLQSVQTFLKSEKWASVRLTYRSSWVRSNIKDGP